VRSAQCFLRIDIGYWLTGSKQKMVSSNRKFLNFLPEVRNIVYNAMLDWPFKPMLKIETKIQPIPASGEDHREDEFVMALDFLGAHGSKDASQDLAKIDLQT
jgi:hypothetical protein